MSPASRCSARVNLRIDTDDRIALLGRNGNGKSTLAKLLAGRLAPSKGRITRADRLAVAYFAQHQLDELDARPRPPTTMSAALMPDAPEAQGARPRRRDRLFRRGRRHAGRRACRAARRRGCCSGLATFAGPHLLILDEPTNHLDIDSRAALIEAINDFPGAVILVSHDRHLIEACADRLWLVDEGTVQPYRREGRLPPRRLARPERAAAQHQRHGHHAADEAPRQVRRGHHPPPGAHPEERRGRDGPDRRAARAVAHQDPPAEDGAGRRRRSSISELRELFENDLKSRQIDLIIDTPLPTLNCEKARLRQVFQNLIDNAIKYMGDGRDARRSTSAARVGAQRGRVLRPRHRHRHRSGGHRTRSSSSSAAERTPPTQNVAGKGVGLASVKSIIETYSGTIWVESELGEGSTFRFTINGKYRAAMRRNDRAGSRRKAEPAA